MVDEIKMSNINTYNLAKNNEIAKAKIDGQETKKDVAVSTQLSDLIKSVNSYIEPISNSALSEIKYRIMNNQYKIDYDKLSDKLLYSGIVTMVGD